MALKQEAQIPDIILVPPITQEQISKNWISQKIDNWKSGTEGYRKDAVPFTYAVAGLTGAVIGGLLWALKIPLPYIVEATIGVCTTIATTTWAYIRRGKKMQSTTTN